MAILRRGVAVYEMHNGELIHYFKFKFNGLLLLYLKLKCLHLKIKMSGNLNPRCLDKIHFRLTVRQFEISK